MNKLILALALVSSPAWGQEMTPCQEAPNNPQVWWSWYYIDGRQCWYEGKPRTKSKGSLYWPGRAEEPRNEGHAPEEATPWEVEHRWMWRAE